MGGSPTGPIEKVPLWVTSHRPHRESNSMGGPPTGLIEKLTLWVDLRRSHRESKSMGDLPQAPWRR